VVESLAVLVSAGSDVVVLDVSAVDVGATLELGATEPEGPTLVVVAPELVPLLLPLGPELPLGPTLPVGPTGPPVAPVAEVFVLVVVVALDEFVPTLVEPVEDALLDDDVAAQAAPVHGSSSPEHDVTQLPAAVSKKPNMAEERNVREEADVDIANSNQWVSDKGRATPQQGDAGLGGAFTKECLPRPNVLVRSKHPGKRQLRTSTLSPNNSYRVEPVSIGASRRTATCTYPRCVRVSHAWTRVK
jgi:hypothetical protein